MARKKKEEVEVKDLDIRIEDNVKAPGLRNNPDPMGTATAVINFGVYSVDLRIEGGYGYGLITFPDGAQYEFSGEIQGV